MHTVNASEKIQATKTQKILKLTLSTRSLVILATHTFKLVPLSGRAMLVCSQHGTSLKRANNFSSNVANRKNSKTYTAPTAAPLNRQQGHSFRLHQHHSSQIPRITRHQHQHHSSPEKTPLVTSTNTRLQLFTIAPHQLVTTRSQCSSFLISRSG